LKMNENLCNNATISDMSSSLYYNLEVGMNHN